MNAPFWATQCLDAEARHALKIHAIFKCCKWDVQREDHAVMAPYALVLDQTNWAAIAGMAERLACEAMALERELTRRVDLHARVGMPRALLGRLTAQDATRAVRVMRFDFHYCPEGWRVSEVNSDVPGGFIEGSGIAEWFARRYGLRTPGNPARVYAEALTHAIGGDGLVAMVHATAYSDDRQVMQYLAQELEVMGLRTAMVSPAHMRFEKDGAAVECRFARGRADAIVRFFPAEWLPNLGRASKWAGFFSCREAVLSNPGSALLLQSKRTPLVWDEVGVQLDAWRAALPEVRCPGDVAWSEREDWVLKPAMGRVGEGVAIAGVTAKFDETLRRARRQRNGWAAQRRFESVPVATEEGDRYACLGVFTVDGRAAGCYGRVSGKPLIDADAQDVAVLVGGE